MKLTRPKLIETIRKKNEGWTTYQARKIAGISIRRVNQVWNEYQLTNQVPDIGKENGRPQKPIEQWEIDMVRQTYQKYRVSAGAVPLHRFRPNYIARKLARSTHRLNTYILALSF